MTTQFSILPIDLVLLIIIAVGLPVVAQIIHLYFKKQKIEGNAKARENNYYHTMILLWLPTLFILWFWQTSERPLSLLGLGFDAGVWSYGALVVAIALSVISYAQYVRVKTNKKAQKQVMAQLENSPELEDSLPQTENEYSLFKYLSITAGITEEILFRGFLIWGFSLYTNIWVASLLALLSFTMGHLYQGTAANLIKVSLAGAFMTGLYLVSGSLIPGIIAHAAIDLASNATAWRVRKMAGS